MVKHKDLKSLLEGFYLKNKTKGNSFIKSKFKSLGAPKRSLDRWLKLLREGKSLIRKAGSGRISKIVTK